MISNPLIQLISSHFLEETFEYKLQSYLQVLIQNQLEELLFESCSGASSSIVNASGGVHFEGGMCPGSMTENTTHPYTSPTSHQRNERQSSPNRDCLQRMASLPQGAFATWKIRENMEKCVGSDHSKLVSLKETEKFDYHFPRLNNKFLEHPPAKYNNKFMNSIWGLYNRYSVHNLKKITKDDTTFFVGEQQCYTAASPTPADAIAGSKGPQGPASLDILWIGNTY